MCGIVAVINKFTNGFTQAQLDAFESLVYIDGLRGMDSTGVIKVSNDGTFLTLKGAVAGPNFLEEKQWETVRREAFTTGSALIGHNRKATKGTINDENAHPFVINDEFALVHNGTMLGDHTKYAKVEVDSHAIAHYLHEHGVQGGVDELRAAYCLFWYDYRNKSVNVIRNPERPMCWMETKDAYYYASEAAFLDFVAKRHKLILLGEIQEQPEYVHSHFTLSDKSWDVDSVAITKKPFVHQSHIPPHSTSKWGGSNEGWAFGFQNMGYDLESDPVGTPNPKLQEYSYLKVVAENSKIFSPASEMEKALAASRKVDKAHGILIDWNFVDFSDKSEGYHLYFSSLDDEEPFIYVLQVSQAAFHNVEQINRLVKDGVIYSLIPKTTRTYTMLNDKFGFVTVPCVSGQEISITSTIKGEDYAH